MLSAVLLAAERILRGTTDAEPTQAASVLLLEYVLPLGCLVHMTPTFEAIKQSRPEVTVAVATSGLGLQVLRHSRFVDRLIAAPNPTIDLWRAVRDLRTQLRSHHLQPDCVLTGASDQRTTIALMGLLGSPGRRAGYTLRPDLYQHPLAYDPTISLIGNNLRMAQMLGCEARVTQPHVHFSAAAAESAASMLRDANPQGRPVAVFVTQGSGGQRTGWHTDRFGEVIRHAVQRLGFAVVYVGTGGDQQAIQQIRTAAGDEGTSLAGKTSVTELAALLAQSDFAVTLDTGTMHVGRAVGVPMVVLGPSWQKPIEWLPIGVENVRILRGEDRESVPPGYRLDEITAASVITALDDLAQAHPASDADRRWRLQRSLSAVDHLA